MIRPFQPLPASTKNIAVAATTASVQIINSPCNLVQIRIVNLGTKEAFIEFGDSTITASLTTSIPVGAGVDEVLTVQCPAGPLYVAAIAAGSTGSVYFTPGAGI